MNKNTQAQICSLENLLPEVSPEDYAFNTIIHNLPERQQNDDDISPFVVSSTPRAPSKKAPMLKSSLKKPKVRSEPKSELWRSLWDTNDLKEEWVEQPQLEPPTPSAKVTFNGHIQEFSRTKSDIRESSVFPDMSVNNFYQSAVSSIQIESLNESPIPENLQESSTGTVRVKNAAELPIWNSQRLGKDLFSPLQLETMFLPPTAHRQTSPSSSTNAFKTPTARLKHDFISTASDSEPPSPTIAKSRNAARRHLPGHFPTPAPKAVLADSPSPPPSPKVVKTKILDSQKTPELNRYMLPASITPTSAFGNQTMGGHDATLRYLDNAIGALQVDSSAAPTPAKSAREKVYAPSSVGDISQTTAYTVKPVVESFKGALRELVRVAKDNLETVSKPSKADSAKDLFLDGLADISKVAHTPTSSMWNNVPDTCNFASSPEPKAPLKKSDTPESLALKLAVTPEDASSVQVLNVSRQKLRSIANLEEKLPKLAELDVSHNELVFLSGAPASLLVLRASYNRLSQLTSFHVLLNLQELDVSHNQLKDLSGVQCLLHLRELNADYNSITALEPRHFSKSLEVLSLKHNLITQLNLPADVLQDGKLRLQSVRLSGNKIRDVSISGVVVPYLTSLELDNNKIARFNVLSTCSLRELDLVNNKLAELDCANLSRLQKLLLNNNAVADLHNLQSLRELRQLNLSTAKGVKFSSDLGSLVHLETLDISGCQLPDGSLQLLNGARHIEKLTACNCGVSFIPKTVAKGLSSTCTELNLAGNALSEPKHFTSLRYLTNLKSLNLARNPIACHGALLETLARLSNLEIFDGTSCPVFLDYYELARIPSGTSLAATQKKLQSSLLLRKQVLHAFLLLQLPKLTIFNQQKVTAANKQWAYSVQLQVKSHVQKTAAPSSTLTSSQASVYDSKFKLPISSPF